MNGSQPSTVSVIDPISPAIERVRTILFDPFDLGKWFVIGFCAWLALLGDPSGGGGGTNIQFPIRQAELPRQIEPVIDNLHWIIPVVVGVAVIVIGLWLVLLWLGSRGQFMFLHCVAQNRAEVTNPWHRFRDHANSLFAFRAVVGLIAFVLVLAPLLVGGILIATSPAAFDLRLPTVVGVVAIFAYAFLVALIASLIGRFTKDFAVPIMYLYTPSSLAAWRILLDLLSANKGRFFLYILFQIVIAAAIGALIVLAVCCTCCLAACLFAVPYIGTVALLPVHAFRRSYSLYYLAQYGHQLNVFAPQPGGASRTDA